MPTIKANTPEELKAQFVLWARGEANQYSMQSNLVKGKMIRYRLKEKSDTFNFIADYWANLTIVKND